MSFVLGCIGGICGGLIAIVVTVWLSSLPEPPEK